MKSTSFVLILFCIFFANPGFSQNKENRAIDDFSSLDVWGNIRIELYQNDSNLLSIDSGTVPLDEVITEVKSGKLAVKMRSNLFKDITVNLKINYKEINDIKANASAQVIFSDSVILENLKIESIGGARVVLSTKLKTADLTAYQGGQVDIKGNADSAIIFANSGGMISGTHFTIEDANIKLNTGGKCEITVTKKIVARVNTKSSLSYFGKPEIEEIKTSLGANVSKWDE